MSKGTVSLWCKDIILSKKQTDILVKRGVDGLSRGRLIGAKINRDKKLSMIDLTLRKARDRIRGLSKRDLLIIGLGLYWGEGSKSESTSGFMFINSDPQMILLVKSFLEIIFKVNSKDILCTVQINEMHKPRINKVLKFWSDLLRLSPGQFNKPYYVRVESRKVYKNYDSYFGTLRLRVRKSSMLKYEILGLIEALKNANLSR